MYRSLKKSLKKFLPATESPPDLTRLPCENCPKILLALLSSATEYEKPGLKFDLGTMETYFHGPCPFHTYLLTSIMNIISGSFLVLTGNTKIAVSSAGPGSICINFDLPGDLHPYRTLLFHTISDSNHVGRGRVVGEWIDLELVRDWRDTCVSQHHQCRENVLVSKTTRVMPYLLIDTYDMCLVKSKPGDGYICLSYVWGTSLALKTLISTFDRYQQHGIFQRKEIAQQIPATVRDAISLTKLLKTRFIWVDALCIIQDDDSFRTRELNAMALIYANAELTIVAANGNDADYGLRGIQDTASAKPREIHQEVVNIPGGPSMAMELGPVVMGEQVWNTRGWTFQESLFSARKLIFIHNRIQWQCLCEHIDEQIDYKRRALDDKDLLHTAHAHFGRNWPYLARYDHLVSVYHQRKFTNPEDIHGAFAGAAAAFSTTALGTFNYGLSESYFDAVMLWDFHFAVDTPLRRISSDPNKHVPSWSWMGWQSLVTMSACWDVYPARRGPNIFYMTEMDIWPKLYATVQWYSISTSTGQKRKLTSHLEQHGHVDEIAKSIPPDGWIRHPNKDPRKSDTYSCLSVPDVEFSYPIPIKNYNAYEPDIQLATWAETSHIIYCRTQRCYLFGGIPQGRNPYVKLTLCDEKGTPAGYLSRIPNRVKPTKCLGARYELVAISRMAQGVISLDEETDYTKRDMLWNVLWIEWVEGIAYRKGIGVVYAKAWEKLAVEDIDLTLG